MFVRKFFLQMFVWVSFKKWNKISLMLPSKLRFMFNFLTWNVSWFSSKVYYDSKLRSYFVDGVVILTHTHTSWILFTLQFSLSWTPTFLINKWLFKFARLNWRTLLKILKLNWSAKLLLKKWFGWWGSNHFGHPCSRDDY